MRRRGCVCRPASSSRCKLQLSLPENGEIFASNSSFAQTHTKKVIFRAYMWKMNFPTHVKTFIKPHTRPRSSRPFLVLLLFLFPFLTRLSVESAVIAFRSLRALMQFCVDRYVYGHSNPNSTRWRGICIERGGGQTKHFLLLFICRNVQCRGVEAKKDRLENLQFLKFYFLFLYNIMEWYNKLIYLLVLKISLFRFYKNLLNL